jgi:hypothetical protein
MKLAHSLLFALPLVALAVTDARDAAACGGCFVPPDENTQVTGHRMLLSVSPTQTTLWDQIEYSGDPASFAWVLPIMGQVEIGLSSDALFAFLGQATQVGVFPPPLNCPEPPSCYYGEGDFGGSTGTGSSGAGGGAGGGVTVVAEQVVGPYETVQLKSSDSGALKSWLIDHNYNLTPDISPVIDAYVAGGFDFLAMKLVPGQGITSMRPVRVTSQGANPTLPLRMVAAGTGAVTGITLFTLGEGRYEAANFPDFTVDPSQVIWNWDTNDSNYAALKKNGFDATNGFGWLTEAARPTSGYDLTSSLQQVAQQMPELSGYGDAMGNGALEECNADIDKLFGSIDMNALWITRIHGELPRAALANDLILGASSSQTQVSNYIQTTLAQGTTPPCPTYPPCDNLGDPGNGNWGGFGFPGGDGTIKGGGGGGCAMGTETEVPAAVSGLGILMALSLARRKKAQKRGR